MNIFNIPSDATTFSSIIILISPILTIILIYLTYKSIIQTKKQFIKLNEPWIILSKVKIDDFHANIIFHLTNNGNTPAYDFNPNFIIFLNDKCLPTKLYTNYIIYPKTTLQIKIDLEQDELKELQSSPLVKFILNITYKSISQKKNKIEYKYTYNRDEDFLINEYTKEEKNTMSFFKFIKMPWQWVLKNKIIPNLLVTIIGVYIAFLWAGAGERKSLDKTTEQQLHLTVLEAQYNGSIAKKIIDIYSKINTDTMRIGIKRPKTIAATTAFENSNILTSLSFNVTLLYSYIDAIATLNHSLEIHKGILESTQYKNTSLDHTILKNVKNNAATVLAVSQILMEELQQYFDPTLYDKNRIKILEDRVEFIKEKALEGKIKLTREK